LQIFAPEEGVVYFNISSPCNHMSFLNGGSA
jgi:hypothetical protein